MNTRSVEILKKLCGGKNYQVEDLAHDFEISIRMIRYVIDDINDFLKIYPNNEYVIYDSVFDYYNKNRVPFVSIKDDEYLKYICCNNELYVKEEIYVE